MKFVRYIVLALLATAAVSAATSSLAQARPAIARCAKVWVVGTGIFKDARCTQNEAPREYIKVFARGRNIGESECSKVWVVKTGFFNDSLCKEALAMGEFIEVHPARPRFVSTSGISILRAATTTVTCASDANVGEIAGEDSFGEVVVTYKGCSVTAGTCTATLKSLTGKEGEIVTNSLSGELGTVKTSEAASGVGVLFKPEKGARFVTFAKTACTPESTVNGSVAGEVTPINALQLTGKVILEPASSGSHEQKIKQIAVLSGKITPELEAFGGEASESSSDLLTFEEEVEIS